MVGQRALVQDNLKRCNQCGEWKSFDAFRKKKARCKLCLNINRKDWASRNPDRIKHYQERYAPEQLKVARQRKQNLESRCKSLMHGINSRAKLGSLKTDLTWNILYVMIVEQDFKCKQTGIAFDFSLDEYGRKLSAPSIDKIDPNGNYTLNNVQIVCWFYNVAKGRFTDDDVWSMMRQAVANKVIK